MSGGAGVGNHRNVIQELVRVFEVKRLASFELQAARRHQIQRQTISAATVGEEMQNAGVGGDGTERALVRRLAHDFNSIAVGRRIVDGPTVDETKFRDIDEFERYLRCE